MKSQRNLNHPLVSIIIPVHNGEMYLSECLESVVRQTYPNFEIIIVDDGSTDGTSEIVSAFLKEHRTKTKILNRKRASGSPEIAFNEGSKIAKGLYLARIDSDDICLPQRIRKQVDFLERNPQTLIVGSNAILIDEKSNMLGKQNLPKSHQDIMGSLYVKNNVMNPTIMVRNIFSAGFYVPFRQYKVCTDYYSIYIRAIDNRMNIHNLQDYLIKYRLRKSSLTHSSIKLTHRVSREIQNELVKRSGVHVPMMHRALMALVDLVVKFSPDKMLSEVYFALRKLFVFRFQ